MIELKLEHPPLEGNPDTILTEQANAGATSIKVANNSGFSANDFIVIGNPGSEFTEIVRISSLSGNDTLNIATALKFSHFYSSPVTLTYYDKIEVERADVKAGPYTLLTTIDIAIDEDFTTYRDETGDIDKFYRIRYKNSYNNKTSAYSSPLAGSGFTDNSVRILLEKAKRLFSRHSEKLLDRDVWMHLLNEGYQEMVNRIISLNKDFGVKKTEITLTAGENTYNLTPDFLTLRRLYVDWGDGNLYPVRYLDLGVYEPVRQTFLETHPFYRFEAGKIVIYPTPKKSGGKLIFYYYYQPAKLQFDDDVLDTSYILPTYASIVIEYVLKRALELDKRYEEANWYGQIFENRIGQLLEIYENRYKEATETIPFWGSDFDISYPFH